MQERLLHFIWQHQYFDAFKLKTADQQDVQVISPGQYNLNSGPDFLHAEILINDIRWQGSVEIHVNSRDWEAHQHSQDSAYDNVILHVVWQGEFQVKRKDGTFIPNLLLQERTPTRMIKKYQSLTQSLMHIPCGSQMDKVNDYAVIEALDKQLLKRLVAKSDLIVSKLKANQNNWEETAKQWLVSNFGFKVNNEPFCELAESLPFLELLRHRDKPIQIEAILFGMAGMLEGKPADLYHAQLQAEFRFLKYKYNLKPRIQAHQWKFLRLRPANFPTMRLAQLANLFSSIESLGDVLLDGGETSVKTLQCKTSEYWNYHYTFGKVTAKHSSNLGTASFYQLIINVIIPLRWTYAVAHGDHFAFRKILILLHKLPAESNKITRLWEGLGVKMESALDSQSYLSLYNTSCHKHRCLDCPIGINLLKTA